MEFDLWQVDFDVLRNVDVRTVDPDTLTFRFCGIKSHGHVF